MGWNALMGRNPQSRTQRLRELGDPPGYRSYPEPQRAAWGRRWQPSSFPLKEALCGAEQRSTQPCNPGTEDRKGAALIGGHSAFIGRQEWDTAVLTGCWSSSGSCLQMDGLCLLPAVEVMLLADGWAAPHELRAQIGTRFSSLCFGVGIFHLCQQWVVVRGHFWDVLHHGFTTASHGTASNPKRTHNDRAAVCSPGKQSWGGKKIKHHNQSTKKSEASGALVPFSDFSTALRSEADGFHPKDSLAPLAPPRSQEGWRR
ncbi:uncharacterized protein LOC125685842 [Lagopus muta]|uniref:uncharacterized protein LOC125685842 n=1 Tax=Lagopus muta TaxID=64668 RepID=UPI00209ED4A8|nr:uncharacterized protein LOC125685842 [Lagopus muta]